MGRRLRRGSCDSGHAATIAGSFAAAPVPPPPRRGAPCGRRRLRGSALAPSPGTVDVIVELDVPRAPRSRRTAGRARARRPRPAQAHSRASAPASPARRTPPSAGATGSCSPGSPSPSCRRGVGADTPPGWCASIPSVRYRLALADRRPGDRRARSLWGPDRRRRRRDQDRDHRRRHRPEHPYFDPAGFAMPGGVPEGPRRSRPRR